MSRRILISAVGTIAAMAAIGTGAASAEGVRQTAILRYTSTVPGTPSGDVFAFDFFNPENPTQKPHAVASMTIKGAEGGTIDTTAPPQCHATDAELLALGPDACPADTKIAGGYAISDTGGGGPFPRYSRTTLHDFNNQGEIIGLGINDDIPAIRAVDRTKVDGPDSSTEFPAFPGAPPPDPYTPFKQLRITFPTYVRNGRPYMRTPPTCPPVGYWVMKATFTYRDGVKQSVESRSPCTQPAAKPEQRATPPKPKAKKRRHHHRRHHKKKKHRRHHRHHHHGH